MLSFVLLFVAPCLSFPFPDAMQPSIFAYYPVWSSLSPDSAATAPVDYVNLAFLTLDDHGDVHMDETNPQRLPQLVDDVHGAGKKVFFTMGGWDGSG